MNRPPMPERELPTGYHFEAAHDPGWRVLGSTPPDGLRQCRSGSPSKGYCYRWAVAALNRGRGRVRREWCYCVDHMYGRWIEDGVVMNWTVREKAAS